MKTNLIEFPLETLTQATKIDNTHYTCEMTLSELQDIAPWVIQRDPEPRLPKMAKIFKKPLPQHKVADLFKVTQQITGEYNGETFTVEPGYYNANGWTRKTFYSKPGNEEYAPKKFFVNIWVINSWEEGKTQYYSFDNSDSSEQTPQKITGAFRLLAITQNLSSKLLRRGGIGTAITLAYPGDSKDSILDKVAYFKDEIVELEKIGLWTPVDKRMKSQAIYALGLMTKSFYNGNAISNEFLKRLSVWDFEDKQANGGIGNSAVSKILVEWDNNPNRSYKMVTDPTSTKFKDRKPNMDFLCYALDCWMNGKNPKQWKPNNADGFWNELKEDLLNNKSI